MKTSDHIAQPFSDDLSESELVSDIGFNKFVIYAGVKLLNALNVKIAVLYINCVGIDSHPTSSNM